MTDGYIIEVQRFDLDCTCVWYPRLDWSAERADIEGRALPSMVRASHKCDASFYENEDDAREMLRHLKSIGYLHHCEGAVLEFGRVVEHTKKEETQ